MCVRLHVLAHVFVVFVRIWVFPFFEHVTDGFSRLRKRFAEPLMVAKTHTHNTVSNFFDGGRTQR